MPNIFLLFFTALLKHTTGMMQMEMDEELYTLNIILVWNNNRNVVLLNLSNKSQHSLNKFLIF